jgi:hypothetical protein
MQTSKDDMKKITSYLASEVYIEDSGIPFIGILGIAPEGAA